MHTPARGQQQADPPSTTKALHWAPLPAQQLIEDTVWSSPCVPRSRLDISALTDQFSRSAKGAPKQRVVQQRPKTTAVIGDKRAMNIGIVLSKLSSATRTKELTAADVRSIVLTAGEGTPISSDEMQSVLQTLTPTEADVAALSEAEELHTLPDRCLAALMSIPRWRAKMDALLFASSFPDGIKRASRGAAVLAECVSAVRESQQFQTLLLWVLSLGNEMNRGRAGLGNAKGFRLESLQTMLCTKSTDGAKSLLDFLACNVAKEDPSLLDMNASLGPLTRDALRVSISSVSDDVRKMQLSLKKAQAECASCEKAGESESMFASAMRSGALHSDTLQSFAALQAEVQSLTDSGAAMLRFYSAAPSVSPDDCLATVLDFKEKYAAAVAKAKAEETEASRKRGSGTDDLRDKIRRRRVMRTDSQSPEPDLSD
eukprot:TRINITY_DN3475_c1_g1_i1.p1 TRINITY_DN3475_c1_g1~~TRINITY_DN3475_c1_g1_i1.p1  ORF type:complete len:480 (+),score=185.81 TRINITY_DN3475_c1_g1_i1:156-1442(+)